MGNNIEVMSETKKDYKKDLLEITRTFILMRAVTCLVVVPAIRLIWITNSPLYLDFKQENYWIRCITNTHVFDAV